MKFRWSLEHTIMVLLLVVCGGVVFHAPLTVGFGALFPSLDVPIKAWKEVLMALAAVLVVVEVSRRGVWRQLAADRLLVVAAAFVAIHVLMLVVFWLSAFATISGLLIDVRFVVYFILVYIALRLFPLWRRRFIGVAAGAALVSMVFVLLQVTVLPHDVLKYIGYGRDTITAYLTVDQNYDYIRINGTLRGPNPLGAYAGMVLALLAAAWATGSLHVRRTWHRVALVVLTVGAAAALWFSYSRSALLGAAAMLGTVFLLTIARRLPVWAWVTGITLAGAVVGVLAVSWQTPFVQNVVLHVNPEGGSATTSNQGHAESLVDGWQRMAEQPLGAGIGSTGSASLYTDAPVIIENYYLFVAHEVGWLGLLLFAVLFVGVMYRLWLRRRDWLALGVFASGIGLALIAVLLPVWADDTVAIVWWGLAAVALAANFPPTVAHKTT